MTILIIKVSYPTCAVEFSTLLTLPPFESLYLDGDFHRGNIIVSETGCTLLDWSGFIGVTHPFLSLWVPLSDWDPSARKSLCESYLEVWSHYGTPEQLRPALALAHPLAALCGALGHRYQINHAHTVLAWDILNEQQNLLDCLRSIFELIDQ